MPKELIGLLREPVKGKRAGGAEERDDRVALEDGARRQHMDLLINSDIKEELAIGVATEEARSSFGVC